MHLNINTLTTGGVKIIFSIRLQKKVKKMTFYGNFDLDFNNPLTFELTDSDEELLSTLDLGQFMISTMSEVVKDQSNEEMENPPKRFKSMEDNDLNIFEDSRHSKATKKNTQWGVKVFQGRLR